MKQLVFRSYSRHRESLHRNFIPALAVHHLCSLYRSPAPALAGYIFNCNKTVERLRFSMFPKKQKTKRGIAHLSPASYADLNEQVPVRENVRKRAFIATSVTGVQSSLIFINQRSPLIQASFSLRMALVCFSRICQPVARATLSI